MPRLVKITAQEVMYPTFQQYLQHFRHLTRLHLILWRSRSNVPLLRHGCPRFPCLKLRRPIGRIHIRRRCSRMFPQPSLSKIQPQQPRKYRPRQERPNRASYDRTLTNRTRRGEDLWWDGQCATLNQHDQFILATQRKAWAAAMFSAF
jgi:hypothetical protein